MPDDGVRCMHAKGTGELEVAGARYVPLELEGQVARASAVAEAGDVESRTAAARHCSCALGDFLMGVEECRGCRCEDVLLGNASSRCERRVRWRGLANCSA